MHLLDVLQGKAPPFKRRSPRWKYVRDEHLKKNPFCAVCGGVKKLRVHHKIPYHVDPTLELDASNLVTLCENSRSFNCHLVVGHVLSYKRWNPTIDTDIPFVQAIFFRRKNEQRKAE